jgi:radical SAM protein with 4Fe4S-binding SPASM domain
MIVRFEPFGAWVKLDAPPALVALDRDAVRALGLDGGAIWTGAKGEPAAPSAPLEAHMAVTSRCAAGCSGCYLDARPDGEEPPFAELLARLDALAARGVFTVAFGGGEPTTRDDLDALARAARDRGMTPVLTTSGLGLTAARVAQLRDFAQVNVSYDGAGDDYARVRGFDGARHAEAAIGALVAAGIPVGVNVVLTRATFDALPATLDRARGLGAREAQLLRYKPAGRAARRDGDGTTADVPLDYLARRLTADQVRAFASRLRALTARCDAAWRVRIDCALVPFLSTDPDVDGAALARLGVLGCEAGNLLEALRVDGRAAPCSFADPADPSAMASWRAWSDAPPEPCASCRLRVACRGGCKVVARFVDGAHGPDPECPRVREHRALRP